MPGPLDFTLAVLVAVIWPLYVHLAEWPAHVKRVRAGAPDARVRFYRRTLAAEWAIAVAIVALTTTYHRSIADALWMRAPQGWRLLVAVALPLTYSFLMFFQIRALGKKPRRLSRLRERLEDLGPLVPTTPVEWQWFRVLAVTAGICEELIFRGYLVWMLAPWFGVWGAAAASAVLFGVAHGYQGKKFAVRAFAAGLGLQVIALLTNTILPGIVLHALIDLGSGYVTYLAMTSVQECGPADDGVSTLPAAAPES